MGGGQENFLLGLQERNNILILILIPHLIPPPQFRIVMDIPLLPLNLRRISFLSSLLLHRLTA